MRWLSIYALLLSIKALSRVFYRFDMGWVGDPPEDPWRDVRLIVFLNHTSLYEPLFAGITPNRILRRFATRGVLPVSERTGGRPMVGRFFKLACHDTIPISQDRDKNLAEVLGRISSDSLVCIAPEGRMMRATGLDRDGRPMTVRGGVEDLLELFQDGRLLIAYSGGLHHVQMPGQLLPKLFKKLVIRFEDLDLVAYREEMRERHGAQELRRTVIADLEARRDRYCTPEEAQGGTVADQAVVSPDSKPSVKIELGETKR